MRKCEINKTGKDKDRETEKKKSVYKNEHIYVDVIYNLSMLHFYAQNTHRNK